MFTLDQFVSIMKAVGGAAEGVDLDGPIADIPLADLGYDSLAALEIQSQVQLTHGVSMPDDTIFTTMTPREAVNNIRALVGAEA